MKKKIYNRKFIVLGLIFMIFGFAFMICSFPSITGFSIYDGLNTNLSSVFSIIFVLVGLLFMNLGLEEIISFKGIGILISKRALDRLKRDRFVKENKKKYIHEINMIVNSNGNRPQEVIKEFHVSPQGHGSAKAPRVAWHYDSKENKLYIDDLLYHERGNIYVDNWANLVNFGKITLAQYLTSGYVDMKETALA